MKWVELGIQTQRIQVQFPAAASGVIFTINENIFICKHLNFFLQKNTKEEGCQGRCGKGEGRIIYTHKINKNHFQDLSNKKIPKRNPLLCTSHVY